MGGEVVRSRAPPTIDTVPVVLGIVADLVKPFIAGCASGDFALALVGVSIAPGVDCALPPLEFLEIDRGVMFESHSSLLRGVSTAGAGETLVASLPVAEAALALLFDRRPAFVLVAFAASLGVKGDLVLLAVGTAGLSGRV